MGWCSEWVGAHTDTQFRKHVALQDSQNFPEQWRRGLLGLVTRLPLLPWNCKIIHWGWITNGLQDVPWPCLSHSISRNSLVPCQSLASSVGYLERLVQTLCIERGWHCIQSFQRYLFTQYILCWHLLVLQRSSFKGIKVFRTVSPAHWLVSW